MLPPRWLPDVFKEPAFASASTWFGAIATLIVFPGAVMGLTAYFVLQEQDPYFTISTTTSVADNFIGGEETGPAYRLDATCRAPAGCFVLFKYQSRGPSEACAKVLEKMNTHTTAELSNWLFVPYGSPLNPMPLVCYSAIARDGIFVAWQRYPPTHQCAVRSDPFTSTGADYRRTCSNDFLAEAAATTVDGESTPWYPCTNLYSATFAGGSPGLNPDSDVTRDQSCYRQQELWEEYYRISPLEGQKPITDEKLRCPDTSAGSLLTCAYFPAGLSLPKSAISDISERTDDVCDLVDSTTQDQAAVQYGDHFLQSRKVELSGDFGCSFVAPAAADAGFTEGDKVNWKYVTSSVQVSTTSGVIPDNLQLVGFEPDSAPAQTGCVTVGTTTTCPSVLPRDKGEFTDTIPKFQNLIERITCAAGKTSATLGPMCNHGWLPNNVSALATLYNVPFPTSLNNANSMYSRYIKDQVVFARLRASPTYQIETITKKDLALLALAVIGSYLSIMFTALRGVTFFYRKGLKAMGNPPGPSDFAFDRASAFDTSNKQAARGVSLEQIQTKDARGH
jgi:hypothetical protein